MNAKFIAFLLGMSICLGGSVALAQVSSADFLPPVQGGPTDVKQPDAVKTEGKTVTAASAQDAINAAVQQNVKDAKAGTAPEVGCRAVHFPSGLGYVSTGAATYRAMENATATRIAKRQAYVIAFTHAKKGLAETLNGLTNTGMETIRESLKQVTLPKEDLVNISTDTHESLAQAVQMMLRGFVIYEVQDDTGAQTVYVSIVTTPKTRGQIDHPTPVAIEAKTMSEGLDQVIAEVKSGIVPPVGGRVVTVRSTGEQAFIGFGSCVVASNTNSAVQAKLNLDAQKVADMRAKDALCGMIIGDQTCWAGGVTDTIKDAVKQFEPLAADDPLAKNDEAGVKKLDAARQTFVATHQNTDLYASVRKGVLPPGIASKTWFDDDHAWAYGMSVYLPSMSQTAHSTAEEMSNAKILQPLNNVSEKTQEPGKSNGFIDENNPNIPRPAPTSKPGPSGTVTPESGL